MLNVTTEDKAFFRGICNSNFVAEPRSIIISLITNESIIEKLKTNMISFNYIISNEETIELVPPIGKTNGSYKNIENVFSNQYTPALNIALCISDIKNVEATMYRVGNLLTEYAMRNRMRMIIGQSIHVNYDEGSGLIYKNLPEGYIIDVIFKYFRPLFV